MGAVAPANLLVDESIADTLQSLLSYLDISISVNTYLYKYIHICGLTDRPAKGRPRPPSPPGHPWTRTHDPAAIPRAPGTAIGVELLGNSGVRLLLELSIFACRFSSRKGILRCGILRKKR